MTESLSHFPKLSTAAGSRESRIAEESGVVINGAKVVFDKEAALMPVNLQPKKEKNENGKYN
jgi:hypothetical protein